MEMMQHFSISAFEHLYGLFLELVTMLGMR